MVNSYRDFYNEQISHFPKSTEQNTKTNFNLINFVPNFNRKH